MTTSTVLGRAASCLEHFAGGLCLTLVAAAFFHAAEAQVSASISSDPIPVVTKV